jgi:hypothetical protein
MTADTEHPASAQEDVDVRKPTVRVRRARGGRSRRSLVATTELLGGLSGASAEAFRTLNEALTPEAVAAEGLRGCLYRGLRDGNARFLEELSETSRRVFDALRVPKVEREAAEAVETGVAQRIDYDRLAGLVAAQMRKEPEPKAPPKPS